MRDGCARFVVSGLIGQFIGVAKSFVVVLGGAESACDIHFTPDHVVPDMIQGRFVARCFREPHRVCHRRIHISGPHRMTDCFMLVHHRFVILHPTVAQSQTRMPKFPLLVAGRLTFDLGREDLRLGIERLALRAMGISSLIEKEFCEVQITALTGDAIQFN